MALERLISSTAGLATPALVVDLAAADRNIAAAANVRLRPHFKAHKCPELMRRQLAGGDCTGVTCATAWEAEVVARAGLHDDILVANEVADPGGAGVAAARRRARADHGRDRQPAPRRAAAPAIELRGADRDRRGPAALRAGPGRRGRRSSRWPSGPGDAASSAACRATRATRCCCPSGRRARSRSRARRRSSNRLRRRARLRARLRRRDGDVRPLDPPRRDPGRLLRPAGRQLRQARPAVRARARLPHDDRLAQRHPRRLRRGPEGALGGVRPARGRSIPAIEVVGLADEHATLRLDAGEPAGRSATRSC